MQLATTLVHQGAMQIAVHAVRTFARHFSKSHRLEIHTDGSVDEANQRILLEAAHGMDAVIVTSEERRPALEAALENYPLTRQLIARGAYFAKLEMPIVAKGPYFYFDSDIVWLRHVPNLVPTGRPNAFSTESWSWYFGVSNDREWVREKTPRRVNSGFYHIGESFPHRRMEEMLEKKMFDPTIPYNTDQEIMAYLFKDMLMYHPEDLKRTRVRTGYTLATETCAALHFPGKMWLPHMDQIEALETQPQLPAAETRYQDPVALSHLELARMRFYMAMANSKTLRAPINFYRKTRRLLSR